MSDALLSAKRLSVTFRQDGTEIKAVRSVELHVDTGETLALVGESGSGKSVTALSLVGLLPGNAKVSGSVLYDGVEMIGAKSETLRRVRGNDISYIFQEPMTSLNPLHTIEKQIGESIAIHTDLRGAQMRDRILELLEKTGIDNPRQRLGSYPHQLSGGQRQRAMIAMALANRPELLVADEPTTALDVTIQAQILELLAELKNSEDLSLLFITHDLNIVKSIADRVCVMHDGKIVESGDSKDIFSNPKDPYTKKLLAAEPSGRPDPVPDNADPVIVTDKMRVWFPIQRGFLKRTVGQIKAVNSASLVVRKGQTVGIVGESGSGENNVGTGRHAPRFLYR